MNAVEISQKYEGLKREFDELCQAVKDVKEKLGPDSIAYRKLNDAKWKKSEELKDFASTEFVRRVQR